MGRQTKIVIILSIVIKTFLNLQLWDFSHVSSTNYYLLLFNTFWSLHTPVILQLAIEHVVHSRTLLTIKSYNVNQINVSGQFLI